MWSLKESQVSLETSPPLTASECQHEGKSLLPPWVHVPIVQSLGPLPTPDSTWPVQVTQVDKNQVLLGGQRRAHHSRARLPAAMPTAPVPYPSSKHCSQDVEDDWTREPSCLVAACLGFSVVTRSPLGS